MDDLVGKEMQPWGLLREMSARGYYLLPDDNLAGFLEPGKVGDGRVGPSGGVWGYQARAKG